MNSPVLPKLSRRDSIVKILIKQWGKSASPVNIQLYSMEWFISRSSFRLSDAGYIFLTSTLELAYYEVPFTEEFNKSTALVVYLDRHVKSPYYISSTGVVYFLQDDYMEMVMFSTDVKALTLLKEMR